MIKVVLFELNKYVSSNDILYLGYRLFFAMLKLVTRNSFFFIQYFCQTCRCAISTAWIDLQHTVEVQFICMLRLYMYNVFTLHA